MLTSSCLSETNARWKEQRLGQSLGNQFTSLVKLGFSFRKIGFEFIATLFELRLAHQNVGVSADIVIVAASLRVSSGLWPTA
ncbi:hypothetical protein CA85_28750 [Allorhodopirellula solitaria]|uniref:Uncharacterized protein n=1 Tax=Allorhodopirellula solitaria TaxID=2527987 RepID=A0A5C5XRZ6_9BACT|nr:hypothetical protein CA85_28750 [Allorhodopirellula solitaria]